MMGYGSSHIRQVLLLNADGRPSDVLNWKDAISLLLRDVAYVVSEYEDWTVNSPSLSVKVPAVLVLGEYRKRVRKVRFSRMNVYLRDDFTCQYCGESAKRDGTLRVDDLSFDHVLPRSRGGLTTWENIVTSCQPCNKTKADLLPTEARMPLIRKPYEPSHLTDVEFRLLSRSSVPEQWLKYLVRGSEVRTG